MKKRTKMPYILCIAMMCLVACKKEAILEQEQSTPEVVVPIAPPKPDPTEPPVNPSYTQTYEIGTGSGDLSINGNSYTFVGNVLFKIKGGKYKSIKISNIDGGNNIITIQNDGLVEMFNSEMRLENLNNVIITGNGTKGIEKGFAFKDVSYRAIQVSGSLDNFTLQYFSFTNVRDYVFSYKYSKSYDGSEKSYSKNLKFLHIDCDNTARFFDGDGSVTSGIQGLIKNIEIAYLNFKNSPSAGSVVYLGNVEDYNIHHNTITNINTTNNEHNGIFMIKGNGKFHNNFISNHQGNAIRAWGHTIGSTPKSILIYNNIIVNSRKYSGFEVQAFANSIISGQTTYTNASVFNNTCGNLNTTNDWYGAVVDVYNLFGGKCDVFNNIGYNFQPGNIIANQQSSLKPNEYNNLYFKTSAEAGVIDQNFKLTTNSPAKSKGATIPFTITDYYGTTRTGLPSIGAVE